VDGVVIEGKDADNVLILTNFSDERPTESVTLTLTLRFCATVPFAVPVTAPLELKLSPDGIGERF
jgi:hypothetical protein